MADDMTDKMNETLEFNRLNRVQNSDGLSYYDAKAREEIAVIMVRHDLDRETSLRLAKAIVLELK